MEDESDDSNNYNSNKIFENGNNNIFSNISISDDPIPILIKPPKTARNKINLNKNKIKSRIQYINRKKLDIYLLNQNIRKYKCSPEEYNMLIIDNLINLKENHLVSVFKDNLICANENEFLRGSFNINDCIEVLPKFYDYYRNYLMFFCKPTFNNFYINEAIQEYGEKQAEVYYKNNYVTKRQKVKNNNLDEKNIDEDDDKSSKFNSSDNKSKNSNETSFVSFRTFFTNSVESMIKKGINSMKKKEEKNKELSSIKRQKNDIDDNTIYLPDNSTISLEDIITKKSSIKNIIDLMKKKNGNKIRNTKKELSNHKEKEIKKKGIIIIDKKKLVEGRNLFNKKRFNSFSKTTINLFDKTKKQRKNSNINLNTNITNKAQPNSNYLKYAGIFKQNKYIKINNIPKIKASSNDLILSPLHNNAKPKKKFINKIPSFKANENIYNFNLTTRNHNINNLNNSKQKNNKNLSNTNKINLPLKIKNFYQKIKSINNNSNSSIQLSICKTTNNRNNSINPTNKNKKIINRTNYNFKKNNKYQYIKKSKVLPLLSPKTNNNLAHNKSLSYSTINNCNININNNIILSNNYIYNNKYLCFHNSQKQLSISNNNKSKSKEKNNISNNTKQNKVVKKSIPLTSRNIKINLDKFKTDQYFLNSITHQEKSNRIILRNKNEKNENKIQYTSFRKANNKDVVIKDKNKNLYKPKKISNYKYNNNLAFKDTLTINKSKNNLNKNDTNSITHTYKSIYIKNNSNNNQRKFIYDYKNKYI